MFNFFSNRRWWNKLISHRLVWKQVRNEATYDNDKSGWEETTSGDKIIFYVFISPEWVDEFDNQATNWFLTSSEILGFTQASIQDASSVSFSTDKQLWKEEKGSKCYSREEQQQQQKKN